MKPYCIDHILLHDHGGEIDRELKRAKAEVELAAKYPSGRLGPTPSYPRGRPVKVDLDGSVGFDVLRVLKLEGGHPLTMGRIAQNVRIVQGAVNAYITALVNKGLVERCPAGRDHSPGARYTGPKDTSP